MNSTNLKEIFLSKIGSTLLYDSLYLFLIVPMGIIGTILNIISLIIFFRKNMRNISFYRYFQIYAINSLILSFTLSFSFFLSPRYFFELSISRAARIFKCLIEPSYILPLALFYSNAMNILLNIERASCFTTKFKYFKNTSPYLICFWLFFICTIINLPTYFLIDFTSDSDIQAALTLGDNNFKGICLRSKSSFTVFGIVATSFGIIIKGILTLILDICSNILAIYFFKRYLKFKIKSIQGTFNSLVQFKKVEKMKHKQTVMAIYLTTFSIVISTIQFAADLMIFFFSNLNAKFLFFIEFLVCFFIAFKQIMNFFFFYSFNSNFRNVFKNMLRNKINKSA